MHPDAIDDYLGGTSVPDATAFDLLVTYVARSLGTLTEQFRTTTSAGTNEPVNLLVRELTARLTEIVHRAPTASQRSTCIFLYQLLLGFDDAIGRLSAESTALTGLPDKTAAQSGDLKFVARKIGDCLAWLDPEKAIELITQCLGDYRGADQPGVVSMATHFVRTCASAMTYSASELAHDSELSGVERVCYALLRGPQQRALIDAVAEGADALKQAIDKHWVHELPSGDLRLMIDGRNNIAHVTAERRLRR